MWTWHQDKLVDERRSYRDFDFRLDHTDPLGYIHQDLANAGTDCLGNQFTSHKLCDENHERQVETRVRVLLEAEDNDSPKKLRPRNLQKLMNP
jgi:hypothetical protein